jgi:hypothetical protein
MAPFRYAISRATSQTYGDNRMNTVIPPWVRGADTLGSITAGTHAGLGLRAAMEREDARKAEEALAREKMAQDQQHRAADILRQDQSYFTQLRLRQAAADEEKRQFEARQALDRDQFGLAKRKQEFDETGFAAKALMDAQLRNLKFEHTTGLAQEVAGGADPIKAFAKFPYADSSLRGNMLQDSLARRREAEAAKKATAAGETVATSYKIPAIEEVEARPPRFFGLVSERKAVQGRPEITVHDKVSRDEVKKLMAPAPAPATPKTLLTPKQKIEKANAISEANPGLTKEEIIRMVESE